MKARLAFLTSPDPGKYVLNFQVYGRDEVVQYEIEDFHLSNIAADGVHFLLRKSKLHKDKLERAK